MAGGRTVLIRVGELRLVADLAEGESAHVTVVDGEQATVVEVCLDVVRVQHAERSASGWRATGATTCEASDGSADFDFDPVPPCALALPEAA